MRHKRFRLSQPPDFTMKIVNANYSREVADKGKYVLKCGTACKTSQLTAENKYFA